MGHLQLFRERLLEKKTKNTKVHATRPKGGLDIHWNILAWRNVQVFIFTRGEYFVPLGKPIFVALLFLSHVFE